MRGDTAKCKALNQDLRNGIHHNTIMSYFFFLIGALGINDLFIHEKLSLIISIPFPWIGTHTSRIQCAIHFDEIDRLSSISHIGYTHRIGARIKGRLNLKSTLSG